jgi:hypothetical protein
MPAGFAAAAAIDKPLLLPAHTTTAAFKAPPLLPYCQRPLLPLCLQLMLLLFLLLLLVPLFHDFMRKQSSLALPVATTTFCTVSTLT